MSKKYSSKNPAPSLTKLIFITVGMFISIAAVFSSLGYVNRTATPPLVQLTISEAGCEYVSKAGVSTEKISSNCTIKVRFKKIMLGDGGIIELKQGHQLQLNNSQIVGMTQLDDGSDEPWTDEHKKAVALLCASVAVMLLLSLVMIRPTKLTK